MNTANKGVMTLTYKKKQQIFTNFHSMGYVRSGFFDFTYFICPTKSHLSTFTCIFLGAFDIHTRLLLSNTILWTLYQMYVFERSFLEGFIHYFIINKKNKIKRTKSAAWRTQQNRQLEI